MHNYSEDTSWFSQAPSAKQQEMKIGHDHFLEQIRQNPMHNYPLAFQFQLTYYVYLCSQHGVVK